MNTTTIRVTANSSWCGIAWTNPGGRIEGRTLPELAALFARASQAERALATVTAERNEAKYWLAAHKAASEALVDPVTGHGFFMLIGKGDDGADGWFYTFGGPLDSYTLCERSDDEDPHFVYFQRERYDHDQGGWVGGVEVVTPVLAPDECSVAPYCLEGVTAERDTLKRERDEARSLLADRHADLSRAQNVLAPEGRALTAEEMAEEAVRLLARIREHERRENALHSKGMQFRQERDALKARLAEAERERDAARGEASIHYAVIEQYRSRLAKYEAVVEAARKMLVEHDTELQETENEARLARALRALDNSGGSGAATSTGTGSASEACSTPEPAGSSQDSPVGVAATLDPQAPATRAELEELRREVEDIRRNLRYITGLMPEAG